MTITPGLAGLLASACVALGLLAVPMLRDAGPVDRFDPHDDPAAGGAARSGPLARLVERLASLLGPRAMRGLSGRRRVRIGRRIDLAGRPGGLTVQRFVGLRAAVFVLAAGTTGLLTLAGGSVLFVVAGGLLGWFAPDIWVSRLGRQRQERIERDLPDFLDILAVTVRAGLGYRAALVRVAESLGGPVGEEMVTALRQMELGVTRRDAFLALRDRNDSASLSSFVAAQLQAEELGVPLSEALNDIALDMRRSAHQAARRRAAQAAPRVSLIVTSLIVPGSMLIILVAIFLGSDLAGSGVLG
jgi:tight adherence protein C